MKKLTKKNSFKNDKKFIKASISKADQKNVKGGFIFQLIDNIRCEVERGFSLWSGGNGDGDW